MKRLDGRVALITGAGRHRGIGEAIAHRLAADGARIVVTDLGAPQPNMPAERIGSTAEIDEIVSELRAAGASAIGLPLDVRDENQVERTVAATTGPDGDFYLEDLPPGDYRLTVENRKARCTAVVSLLPGKGPFQDIGEVNCVANR